MVSAFDLVPFLPPRDLYRTSPYAQSGKLLMLLDGPNVTVADPDFFDNIPSTFKIAKSINAHFNVNDHRIWTNCDRASEKLQGITLVSFDQWSQYAVTGEKMNEVNKTLKQGAKEQRMGAN